MTQKEQWHREEDIAEKFWVYAHGRRWWIRKDRVQNSALLCALLECKDEEETDISSLCNDSKDTNKFIITVPEVTYRLARRWEVHSVFTHRKGCAVHIIGEYETREDAQTKASEEQVKIKNPHFHIEVCCRNDDNPYDPPIRVRTGILPL
jgi:hypothetical protein